MSWMSPVILTSSIYLEGSVSHGRRYERRKYNAQLLGLTAGSANGAVPYSSVVQDVSLTGTFTSPSWTHRTAGFNQAFVGVSLSSSYVETRSLNYFRSGTAPLESSAVPASGTLFYSKNTRLQTIIVKHSASAADVFTPSSGVFPPIVFVAGTGTYLGLNTGSTSTYLDGTGITSSVGFLDRPTTILMNVPVKGRLVDIKVWIDVIHLSSSAGQVFPLSNFAIALRSPNVRWGNAHPVRNDKNFLNQTGKTGYDLSFAPFSFYRDTFILWEGPSIGRQALNNSGGPFADNGPWQNIIYYPQPGTFGSAGSETAKYPSWQRDRCMRTIFTDGSPTPNPRHLYSVNPSGNFVGAPCRSPLLNSLTASAGAYGFNVPWTSDKGGLRASDPQTYITGGSPPRGWLNGPGGTNDVNEWPTTGVNYGAETIKPLYPLLDPIFIMKTGTDEGESHTVGLIPSTAPVPPSTPETWRGFRPGLRGTEISGTWQLLFINDCGQGNFIGTTGSADLYFRQARLEITYESPLSALPNKVRRSSQRFPAHRAGNIAINVISGSDSNSGDVGPTDYFKTVIYVEVPQDCEIGRTFGLTVGTGSANISNFALSYQLSGTLAGISGTGPGWLTNNQFGMPQIPFSSATLAPPSVSASIVTSPPLPFISPSKELDGPRRLEDVAQDVNPRQTLTAIAADFVSSSLS